MGYVAVIAAAFLIGDEERTRADLAREMADEAAPVIELNGGDEITIAVGDQLVEPGFDIYDDRAWPEVTIESMVDTRNAGNYIIRYTASDGNGNVAKKERKVKVVEPAGRIYLTFDDGPSEYTGMLLDVLKKYGVRATFFVTGYGDDELIQREQAEGHAVAIHTFSHLYANIYASVENFTADFRAVEDRVIHLTGVRPKLMRFPGGSSNLVSARYDGGNHIMSRLVDLVREWGYTYFDWNVDSNDAGAASTTEEVYDNVVNTLKWGGNSVVLQHDTKEYSVKAVERIIQYGLEHNFVFDSLDANDFAAHHSVNN
ncbi:polysaccharide deacetylase family protein [Candidatus Saccharibacteria bacterium]|nr:polysaccharide deacetylase family protein [Candidatus Saccharibacteria bacterium]